MQRLDPLKCYPLHSITQTRALEHNAMVQLPEHTLMQRAGLAVANLACALAPHARTMWVACGPGNNGGDGLEAAVHLQQRGYRPVVTWLGEPHAMPMDAKAAWQRAVAAGVGFETQPPLTTDLCIDALLGIGSTRPPMDRMALWIESLNASSAPVLAVDIATGLNGDTGSRASCCVRADHTLSLLTLKPGLFTAQGRDASGDVWWDALGVSDNIVTPEAVLSGSTGVVPRSYPHAIHKGTRGDVAVVGGAPGMVGAAFLAACAALHAGAGRVFVSPLDASGMALHPTQPELMLRSFTDLPLEHLTLVCGCGGGTRIQTVLPELLRVARTLVLDADALNAIAALPNLQELVRRRGDEQSTVLTPHPLEAARLLGCDTAQVQDNRLAAARELVKQFRCVVVLKGSGTITTAPLQTAVINSTGNGLLATGGTGDVLAGLIGARMACGTPAFDAAWRSAMQHGQVADHWPAGVPLTASALARALR